MASTTSLTSSLALALLTLATLTSASFNTTTCTNGCLSADQHITKCQFDPSLYGGLFPCICTASTTSSDTSTSSILSYLDNCVACADDGLGNNPLSLYQELALICGLYSAKGSAAAQSDYSSLATTKLLDTFTTSLLPQIQSRLGPSEAERSVSTSMSAGVGVISAEGTQGPAMTVTAATATVGATGSVGVISAFGTMSDATVTMASGVRTTETATGALAGAVTPSTITGSTTATRSTVGTSSGTSSVATSQGTTTAVSSSPVTAAASQSATGGAHAIKVGPIKLKITLVALMGIFTLLS